MNIQQIDYKNLSPVTGVDGIFRFRGDCLRYQEPEISIRAGYCSEFLFLAYFEMYGVFQPFKTTQTQVRIDFYDENSIYAPFAVINCAIGPPFHTFCFLCVSEGAGKRLQSAPWTWQCRVAQP